ncbi:MAG: SDR family oxidoreductase [Eubacteriales bacterium]|nr:SDR family oxidoreductase [Eubacteriales bacterium]
MDCTKQNYVDGKVIIITGASGGFGALTAERASEMGAKVVLAARNEEKLKTETERIRAAGGEAAYCVTDVTKRADVYALAKFAVETYGRIDVLVNNAGTMPLAFFRDHEKAMDAWENCIDLSLKGTLYGIAAVYDQMIAQGGGHIINVSSIYANFPVAGAGVYQACKMGVKYLGDSLRNECQGKIRVSVIKPTGVPTTGLMSTVIDPMAGMYNIADPMEMDGLNKEMPGRPDLSDINNIKYMNFDPAIIADNIIFTIDQPMGLCVSDITVRGSGDMYCL